MAKKRPDADQKTIEAALRLAVAHDWNQITLERVAKTAKIPLAQVKNIFGNTNDILTGVVAYIDAETAKAVGKPVAQGSPHDRLFEVLMARFDVLQRRRPAILRIISSCKRDPSLMRVLLPAHAKSMRAMLRFADLKENGLREYLVVAGLLAVYGVSLFAWERDESADMSKTMAALDRHLRRSAKLAEILFRAV